MPAHDTSGLETERRNPETADIDSLQTGDFVRVLHAQNFRVAEAVSAALPAISTAIEVIADRLERGGRLFYMGAGTSGRIGVLDASECPPTFGVSAEMVQGIIAGGDSALRNSIEGAEDDSEAGEKEIPARGVRPVDVVVGIAASGRTPYVIGAIRGAKAAGAYTIAVVNVSRSRLESEADLTITAVTGPEAITGSTRLKAGTAQKMILNLLSTGAMVRLGKTYGNLMVDVAATNDKLKERAILIVMEAAGVNRDRAESALQESDWRAKIAIVAAACGVSSTEAAARLAASGGYVKQVLCRE